MPRVTILRLSCLVSNPAGGGSAGLVLDMGMQWKMEKTFRGVVLKIAGLIRSDGLCN